MKIVLSLFTIFALVSVLHADNEVIGDVAQMDVMTIGEEIVSSVEEMPATVSGEIFDSVPVEVVQDSSSVIAEGENISYYDEGTDVEIYPIDASIPVESQDVVAIVSEPMTNTTEVVAGVENGYYVQVIAFSKSSPDAVVSKLESKGFNNYQFQNIGEITKLIVGPYDTRNDATKVLKKLKRVRKDAFIYQQ